MGGLLFRLPSVYPVAGKVQEAVGLCGLGSGRNSPESRAYARRAAPDRPDGLALSGP